MAAVQVHQETQWGVRLVKTPKAPKPTPEQLALEKLQTEQLANLDTQENERRKRLFRAVQGIRAFRGAPILRAAPSDTKGTANPSVFAGQTGAAATTSRGGAGAGAGVAGGSGWGGSFGRRVFVQ